MKCSDVIKLLEKQIARLHKLDDETLSGFVLIVPPDGQTLAHIVLESAADERSFYQTVASMLVTSKENAQLGGVNVPGMRR